MTKQLFNKTMSELFKLRIWDGKRYSWRSAVADYFVTVCTDWDYWDENGKGQGQEWFISLEFIDAQIGKRYDPHEAKTAYCNLLLALDKAGLRKDICVYLTNENDYTVVEVE